MLRTRANTMASALTHFLSCDWGTSSFRLRLVRLKDGQVLAQRKTAQGAKVLTAELPACASLADRARAFHDYLSDQVKALSHSATGIPQAPPIVISGMASSSVGWMELPYAKVPFPLDGSGTRIHPLELQTESLGQAKVLLVSGVATDTDMMRGEETELMGLLSLPSYDHLKAGCRVILPGTHTKHAVIADGSIQTFHTYMSGELFDVLRHQSILRFTTDDDRSPIDWASFEEGVLACRELGFGQALFQTRSRSVLHQRPPAANRDFLSGLLVASEWMDLARHSDPDPILVAAPGDMGQRHAVAARALEMSHRLLAIDGNQLEQAVVFGHRIVLQQWLERSGEIS